MPHRLRALALTVPLLVAGSLVAHEAGYRLAEGDSARRASLLEASGHAYLMDMWLVLLAAISAALVLELVLGVVRGPTSRDVPAWPFALLAPLGFLVQEHVERLLHGVDASATLADRSVQLGLALQVPFAVASWMVARAALRGSELVISTLGHVRVVPVGVLAVEPARRLATAPRARRLRAFPVGGRAPPPRIHLR